MTIPVPTASVREKSGQGNGVQVLTGLSTLTKGEPRSDLGRGLVDKIANHLNVVTRHNHFLSSVGGTLWPMKANGNISCAQEELRAVVIHERSVSTTLLLSENLKVSKVGIGVAVYHV